MSAPGALYWVRTASLFLFRSRRATLILSLMILSAVSTMTFLVAMSEGVNDTMVRNSVELYSGHITGFDLPADFPKERLSVPGVAAVLRREARPGVLMNGTRPDAVLLVLVQPEEEARRTALARKTVEGHYLEGDEKGIFLSRTTAEKLGVKPGETVEFGTALDAPRIPLTVSGVFHTGFDQLDQGVAFAPLGALPAGTAPWSAAVFLDDGVDPETVIASYRSAHAGIGDFKAWSELMPDLKQLVDLNYVSMSVVLVLVFGVVSLGIGCAFVIFILKNVREFGIMKAMGVTPGETLALISFEVILMNVIAAVLAVAVGALVTWIFAKTGIDLTRLTSHNRYFTVSGMVYPRLTSFSLLAPPLLAVFSGLAASLWPAVIVIRKRTADILRIV